MSELKTKIYFYFRSVILPIKEINESLPKKGEILDLGFSYGALSIILSRFSNTRKVIGWDSDKKKLEFVKKSLKGEKNISFYYKDVVKDKWPKVSGILASDFFHHLPKESQEIVIKKAYKALRKNGVFVVKEVDKHDRVRALMSRTWDKILYPKDKVHYRSKSGWERILKREGFRVYSKNLVLWFPNSTRLFVCRKT